MIVYALVNSANFKVYIGQTRHSTLSKRWNSYLSNSGCNPHLKAAIQKYGHQAFRRTVLARTLCQMECDALERWFIQYVFRSYDRRYGYNLALGGKCEWRLLSPKHRKRTEPKPRGPETSEWREKISMGVSKSWARRKKPPGSVRDVSEYQPQGNPQTLVSRKQCVAIEDATVAIQLRQVARAKRQLKTIQEELERIRYELQGGCLW